MAENVVTVDQNGVSALDLEQNVEQQRAEMRGVFGDDLTRSDQAPPNQIAGIQGLALTEVGEGIVADGNANNPDMVGGAVQDQLYGLLDIQRRTATRSRVTATLTGVAGTGVPAGSRAKTTAGAEFETLAVAILSPSGVSVEMQAVNDGPVAAAAGTLTQIVTVIAGWETITNASAAVLGRARQSDDEYRRTYRTRTAHSSIGPCHALEAALEEAGAERWKVAENNTAAAVVEQEFSVGAHSLLVIAESGSDADIQRAVENHRGMGAGTTVALRGGTPDNTALDSVNNGSIIVDGTTYGSIDLTSANTGAAKATALTTAIDGSGVIVRYVDDAYMAFYQWTPNYAAPVFTDASGSDVAEHFALRADDLDSTPPGPFMRTREQALTITAAVTRQAGFPADGLARMRAGLIERVNAYTVGEQVWLNDLLVVLESVAGTRVTTLTVTDGTSAVSGVAVPLDRVWTLPLANITVTIT